MRKVLILCFILLFNVPLLFGQTGKKGIDKILTSDHYQYIAVNEIKMWVSNCGDGSHDPFTDGGGFYWPGGENATITAVFEDGLLWGGIVNSGLRVNGNTHRIGLQAGKILPDGLADDTSITKYRVYKILEGWENLPLGSIRDKYELDYKEWPVEDGAPWIDMNGDGIYTAGKDKPKYAGDETMWYVANDLDTTRSTFTYGSLPIGLEFQTTTYAFNRANLLANAVIKKYLLVNKSKHTVENMYLAYWADNDLGNAADDFSGCDTLLNMGYSYNGDDYDENGYGILPPAIGHTLLQSPIVPGLPTDSARIMDTWRKGFRNLKMTSFSLYRCGAGPYLCPGSGIEGGLRIYNNMQGLDANGNPYIDPNTGLETNFCVPGDPASGKGWYEGSGWPGGYNPGDRYYLVSSGPFTFTPGDTQEVAIGILISRGESNLQSVAELKKDAAKLQLFYDNYKPKIPDPVIELPKYYSLSQNYPNPFNPATTIKYALPIASLVILKVHDILGNEISTLVSEEMEAGEYKAKFSSDELSSGVYFYTIIAREFTKTRKMLVLK